MWITCWNVFLSLQVECWLRFIAATAAGDLTEVLDDSFISACPICTNRCEHLHVPSTNHLNWSSYFFTSANPEINCDCSSCNWLILVEDAQRGKWAFILIQASSGSQAQPKSWPWTGEPQTSCTGALGRSLSLFDESFGVKKSVSLISRQEEQMKVPWWTESHPGVHMTTERHFLIISKQILCVKGTKCWWSFPKTNHTI